ncbi:MAG: TFIIB-type zinc finger domain-containing protein [Chloroflexota bacterium]
MMNLVQMVQPLLTIFGLDDGRETAVTVTDYRRHLKTMRFDSNGGSVLVFHPAPADTELAQIIVGNLFGLVADLRVLERTNRIILVDVIPYLSPAAPRAADPVIPLVTVKTSWLYQLALRRFVHIVATYNWMRQANQVTNRNLYYRRAKFWARQLINRCPLTGAENEYHAFHVLKTLNNPQRQTASGNEPTCEVCNSLHNLFRYQGGRIFCQNCAEALGLRDAPMG